MSLAFLLADPIRSAAIGGTLVFAIATGVQTVRLDNVTEDRDAKAKLIAEIDAKSDAARAAAEAERDAATAERDRLLGNLPSVGATIIKEREVHYAQNPAAAAAVCLPGDRVQAANGGISRLAAAAGVEPLPSEAPAPRGADR